LSSVLDFLTLPNTEIERSRSLLRVLDFLTLLNTEIESSRSPSRILDFLKLPIQDREYAFPAESPRLSRTSSENRYPVKRSSSGPRNTIRPALIKAHADRRASRRANCAPSSESRRPRYALRRRNLSRDRPAACYVTLPVRANHDYATIDITPHASPA